MPTAAPGDVAVGTPFPAAFAGPDRAIVVDRDSLDVPVIRVFSIRRG